MKYLFIFLFTVQLLAVSCTGKKTTQNQSSDSTMATSAVSKQSLADSIDQNIATYERRLDVKMRRKVYEQKPGDLVTLQKWFEYGDSTKLVKLREEIITGDTKMEVIQYHYQNQTLTEIHDYLYDKKCDGAQKQCMTEEKYFFRNGQFDSALRREAVGSPDSVPVLANAVFQPFSPEKTVLTAQQDRLVQINKKYAILPYQRLAKVGQ